MYLLCLHTFTGTVIYTLYTSGGFKTPFTCYPFWIQSSLILIGIKPVLCSHAVLCYTDCIILCFKMAYRFHIEILFAMILCLIHCFLRRRLRQQGLLEIWRLRRGIEDQRQMFRLRRLRQRRVLMLQAAFLILNIYEPEEELIITF